MNTHEHLFLRLIIVLAIAVAAPVRGQNAAVSTGTIEGRVLNETNGNYLNNARVTIPGTNLEVFTNEIGEYRLTNAPTGQVTVQVAFTGLAPETATVSVQAGQRVTHNFTLNRTSASAGSGTVVMDAFVTAAARDMSGSEIALNEQRFSANLKNVVSADEFGDIGEGNIGEFLKMLPGITMAMPRPACEIME